MTGLIGGGAGKIAAPPPVPPPPPPPPTAASTGVATAANAEQSMAQAAGAYGGTLLTSGQGTQTPQTTSKKLLGE